MAKSITDKKDTYLVAAEMSAEDNYNMVGDGVINNALKPSMLERLEEFEQKKKERHKSDRIGDSRERHREARNSQDNR